MLKNQVGIAGMAQFFGVIYIIHYAVALPVFIIAHKIGLLFDKRRVGCEYYCGINYHIFARLRALVILHFGIGGHFINGDKRLPNAVRRIAAYLACNRRIHPGKL